MRYETDRAEYLSHRRSLIPEYPKTELIEAEKEHLRLVAIRRPQLASDIADSILDSKESF